MVLFAGASVGLAPLWSAPHVGVAAAATSTSGTGPSVLGHSYSLLTTGGALVGFGAALSATSSAPPGSTVVGVAPTPDGHGAWAAEANGAILTFGDAKSYGSMAGHPLAAPIVGIAAAHTGDGYWEVASDGGIFTFGTAQFYGSMGGKVLFRPVVGIAATPTGHGYWEVASDGGIFTFGTAQFHGSMGGKPLVRPVVGIAATPTGDGYWEVASDGGIFTFGTALFYGSAAPRGVTVVGMAIEAGGYQNPLRAVANLVPERVDQGVDYAGSGTIFAIGDGVVLNTTNAGWPGGAFISYQLSDGPAVGDIVYVAENVTPRVTIGQQVSSSTVLGTLIDAYPNLEIGWADPPGNGESLARAQGQWTTYDGAHSLPSAYGENFSQLLDSLGAPPGINYGPVQGTVPGTWPTW